MGRKGRKSEAPAMLNMLPKFELVPISKYFMTLPKALRPSMMPSCRTRRPGSTRITSAASRATSAAGYGDTDIGRIQRWRVVDAVTHEPHRMAVVFEGEENAVFLYRRNAREDVRLLDVVRQRRIRHPVQIFARNHLAGIDAYLCADVAGHAIVVTGDDLDFDPILLQGSQNLRSVRQRRIRKAKKTRQDQIALVLD